MYGCPPSPAAASSAPDAAAAAAAAAALEEAAAARVREEKKERLWRARQRVTAACIRNAGTHSARMRAPQRTRARARIHALTHAPHP